MKKLRAALLGGLVALAAQQPRISSANVEKNAPSYLLIGKVQLLVNYELEMVSHLIPNQAGGLDEIVDEENVVQHLTGHREKKIPQDENNDFTEYLESPSWDDWFNIIYSEESFQGIRSYVLKLESSDRKKSVWYVDQDRDGKVDKLCLVTNNRYGNFYDMKFKDELQIIDLNIKTEESCQAKKDNTENKNNLLKLFSESQKKR